MVGVFGEEIEMRCACHLVQFVVLPYTVFQLYYSIAGKKSNSDVYLDIHHIFQPDKQLTIFSLIFLAKFLRNQTQIQNINYLINSKFCSIFSIFVLIDVTDFHVDVDTAMDIVGIEIDDSSFT